MHSAYEGPKWRGIEKCQGVALRGPGVAHAFYLTREDAQENCPMGFRVVEVTLNVPEVGALLATSRS